MKDSFKKKITLISIFLITVVLGIICGIYLPNSDINKGIQQVQTELIKEIVVSEETKTEAEETKKAVEKKEKIQTTEIAKSTIEEEKEVTDEGADESLLEPDALVEQENISYDGDNAGKGLNLLGKWQGLTYYSQADSRWANKLYTSVGNRTQTMKSSACGPTCSAMVVSSAKGAILPTTMARLSVDNGFRTANNGTAWALYPFVADYFGFKEYHKTSNFDTAMNYLKQKNAIGTSKYYIICSCGSGLFTSGGHYIVLASLDGNKIRVLDPYLYSGKFNTASRRNAKAEVKGTSVYVTKYKFQMYANARNFWIYSNDKGNEQKKTETAKKTTQKKSSNSQVKKSTATKKTKAKPTKSKVKNTVGKKKVLKYNCYLYKNKNLKGTVYTYKRNTTVRVLKNINSKIDYIQVIYTGRKAYVKISNYK
jgi:hypothetical protein